MSSERRADSDPDSSRPAKTTGAVQCNAVACEILGTKREQQAPFWQNEPNFLNAFDLAKAERLACS